MAYWRDRHRWMTGLAPGCSTGALPALVYNRQCAALLKESRAPLKFQMSKDEIVRACANWAGEKLGVSGKANVEFNLTIEVTDGKASVTAITADVEIITAGNK